MYEGNITYGWGGLSGYTETRRAWTAFTNQVAMAGHSNTDLPPKSFEECMAPGLDPGRVECNAIVSAAAPFACSLGSKQAAVRRCGGTRAIFCAGSRRHGSSGTRSM